MCCYIHLAYSGAVDCSFLMYILNRHELFHELYFLCSHVISDLPHSARLFSSTHETSVLALRSAALGWKYRNQKLTTQPSTPSNHIKTSLAQASTPHLGPPPPLRPATARLSSITKSNKHCTRIHQTRHRDRHHKISTLSHAEILRRPAVLHVRLWLQRLPEKTRAAVTLQHGAGIEDTAAAHDSGAEKSTPQAGCADESMER